MALHYNNTDAVENEVGGLKGPLGAPMSSLCDSLKRQRTFSDISTEPPSSPTCSIMSPMSTQTIMSPTLGSMSPMMGMSSPKMGALPEGTEYHSEPFSMLSAAEEPTKVFYEPNDETHLMLAFMDFVPCSQEEEEEKFEREKNHTLDYVEKDGVTWEVTRGRPPTMSQLEDKLAEVKSLYKTKYGEDVDDEDDEKEQAEESEVQNVEKDGLTWEVTRGRPPTMSQLEANLAKVKSLYKTKYGADVDDDEDEEEEQADEREIQYVEKDGVTCEVTRGRPPTMSQLEDKLAEVKSLYTTKYGEDVDDEDDEAEEADEREIQHVEKDGVTWEVTRGHPPTMSQLENKLAEVKSLYKTKYGEDVDDEEDEAEQADERDTQYVEKDGVTWEVTRGRPPTMSQLEDKLVEVKSLYKMKYGEDVDDEDDEEEQADEREIQYVEKDGITWEVTRGRPPTMSQLEDKLAEVKSLYKTKYGEDVDDEEEEEEQAEEHEIQHVEKDGITWEVTRGRPPTMSELEKQLLEVKILYRTKYGEYVDDEDEEEEQVEEHEIQHVEKDGVKWELTRGRPPTMSQLEDRLNEVKSLYKTKYGEDVDDEEEETDEHEIQYVYIDGVAWEVNRGRAPTTSKLETMLAEVKSLYKTKYGEDVDDEEDEEDEPSTVEA